MSGITPFVATAIVAILEVQRTLKEISKQALIQKHEKGAGGDVSIEADWVCEDIYVKHLLPFGTIHSEERGIFESQLAPEHTIILDPLDGSDNFVASIPYYGTSISLHNKDHTIQAALVANYCSSEIYFKDEAYCGGRPFMFSHNMIKPFDANVCTSKVGIFEASWRNPKLAQNIYAQGFKLRSPGALALSLANAKGCSFVLYCGRLRAYDIEAGIFISKDLNIYRSDDAILIAREKDIFETIKMLICDHERSQYGPC